MTGSTTITHARRYAGGHAAGNETSGAGVATKLPRPPTDWVYSVVGPLPPDTPRDLGSMAAVRYSKETPHVEGKSCGL
jgi:hypothetical protein